MSSTTRSRAKRFSRGYAPLALACIVVVVAAMLPASAQSGLASSDFWFAGTRLPFERPQFRAGHVAIGSNDAGLARFLAKTGATLAYEPGQRNVIVTAADRRLITFTLGDPRFSAGAASQIASFAPYAAEGEAYLPFLDLARALYVDAVDDAGVTVMQPQIGALDVRTQDAVTTVTLRGGTPLRYRRLSKANDPNVVLAFSGTASTLEAQRTVTGPALRGVTIVASGPPRNPTTTVTFLGTPGSAHALVPADSSNALGLSFAPAGVALGGDPLPSAGTSVAGSVAAATERLGDPPASAVGPTGVIAPPVPAIPATAQTPTAEGLATAAVTDVEPQSVPDGYTIRLAISSPVTYEWHRLPDNRWYVDLKPASLAIDALDRTLDDPALIALRVKGFTGPTDHLPTVRLALTLPSPRTVDLLATADGLAIGVGASDDTRSIVTASGEIANGNLIAGIVPLPAPAATAEAVVTDPSVWKFNAPSGVKNPRLIVIDPGHGGSDTGAEHNGLVEKDLNLDVARRLRAVLIARGWQVKMTRDSDVDVFAPNDSAHDELQARVDVANGAGARMLISIHTNSFTSSDQNGTTTYYYTSASHALAAAVHARLAATLPTADDGVRRENFYVIHHQTMPGILVEMAFLSNPGDARYLRSSAFLQSVATGIANGVGDYASGAPVSSTATDSDGN